MQLTAEITESLGGRLPAWRTDLRHKNHEAG